MRTTIATLSLSFLLACGSEGTPGASSSSPAKSAVTSARPSAATTTTASATATATSSASAAAATVDQSKPENVVNAIFEAGKNDDPSNLASLCDESVSKDGDVKMICAFKKGDDKWEKGKGDMVTGKIVSTKVDGDSAKVEITFGKDGTKKETVELKKVGEKWFLAKM